MNITEMIQIIALTAMVLNSLVVLVVVTLVFISAQRNGVRIPLPGGKKTQRKTQKAEEVRTKERSEAGEILE